MMGRQSDIFLKGEGAAWLERNKDKIDRENDPVLAAIREAKIRPRNVLEIGCANGWRLDILRDEFECEAIGQDPGASGLASWIYKGTADDTNWESGCFDLLIYGFCLYLCDREDLFKIVAEGDRVLRDGGYLVIWDFYPEYPHAVPYRHYDGIFSYKMDYAQLWLANPAYSLFWRTLHDVTNDPGDMTAVTILKKGMSAWIP